MKKYKTESTQSMRTPSPIEKLARIYSPTYFPVGSTVLLIIKVGHRVKVTATYGKRAIKKYAHLAELFFIFLL